MFGQSLPVCNYYTCEDASDQICYRSASAFEIDKNASSGKSVGVFGLWQVAKCMKQRDPNGLE